MHLEKSAHRDVKPDNYIYSLKHKNIKLSDFGLSEFILADV